MSMKEVQEQVQKSFINISAIKKYHKAQCISSGSYIVLIIPVIVLFDYIQDRL